MGKGRVIRVAGGVVLSLLLIAGTYQAAADKDSPADQSAAVVSAEHMSLAEEAVAQLAASGSSGSAEMAVVDYGTYARVLQADAVPSTPLLGADEDVIVVALDGHVDISEVRFAPNLTDSNAPSFESGRGILIALDESGRILSRLVLLVPPEGAAKVQGSDARGAIERLVDLGVGTVAVNP